MYAFIVAENNGRNLNFSMGSLATSGSGEPDYSGAQKALKREFV